MITKINVKLWNKRATDAKEYVDIPAVSIFPDKNKGMIYCRSHEWKCENSKYIAEPLDECIIEIEEEGFGEIFRGTFKELCNKLKQ